ncbi:fatty acid desaturase family protein [Pigmentibacter sp. JX0631]|uniref:fatty acid desaturase family protein n=1 Tax=Pigmentibacter sp. JX0631 TaxID=2976982 RepID=UPI002468A879|nr:fatty acid desaturase family protein [Pigmentibacter sp. JX0631]WGL59186.1 fatty acid desaturase family protein [Pigmentibacter sp. JX0631]
MLKDNIRDITDAIKFISQENKIYDLKNLENTSNLFSIFFITYIWLSIFAAWYLVAYKSFYFFPLAIIIFGIQQRTMRNILHDASHYSLFKNQYINDLAANLFAGYSFFENIKYFRKSHLEHHKFLGIQEKDPDFVSIELLDPTNQKNSLSIFITALKSKRWIVSSYLGNLFIFSFSEIIRAFTWWIFLSIVIIFCFSLQSFFIFLILWFSAKLTIYHCLKVFMEISDHAGLPLNGIIKGTRNHPDKITKFIFFPFGDNYHLTHHLFPKIQTYKLEKMHKILLNWPNYSNACNPKNYIKGNNSVLKSWIDYRFKYFEESN